MLQENKKVKLCHYPIGQIFEILVKNVFNLLIKNEIHLPVCTDAVARKCSVKEVFLEISQNSLENNCARVSLLIKLQVSASRKFLGTTFLKEYHRWLLLEVATQRCIQNPVSYLR